MSVAFLVAALGMLGYSAVRHVSSRAPSGSTDRRLKTGEQVIAFFVGAKFCAAYSREGFPETVRTLREKLAGRASEAGMEFVFVGVALDWTVEDGLEFLERFGPFDEIVAGQNWLNETAIRYIWRDLPGRAAVPQVILLHREIRVDDRVIQILNEQIMTRRIGVDGITEWLAAGDVY
jgi:hypothetical protein